MLDTKIIDEFRQGFLGRLIQSDDPDCNNVRKVYNGMINKRPALIAQCRNQADVKLAVDFGRTNNRPISIRGDYWKALKPYSAKAGYLNFNQDFVEDDIIDNYGFKL